ncbi:serine hydrolase domain-containing protein [Alteromonas gilva]|uniref:Serine hydrolase n=1 Tax=Alteromonas gilva TaxID=2987522 RepID=A0ABT5L119_9ALTE|nr:serine hydrolase domain-containing protein [Alteromonas gilva]MDC8829508.1 serine hydrolase [Alteromonas gilva]
MSTSALYPLLILLSVGSIHTVTAKENAPPAALNKHFEKAVTSDTVPGINVAVADKNGLVWAKGYGYADLENQVAMTPQHKMRIGSVAKVITAAALMRMVEQGTVELDKPITDYLPDWPAKHPAITLRQLTSHTAGIRHYKAGANEFLLNQPFDTMQSSLALFQQDDLSFAPGSAFAYSTFGWTVVSAVMESATMAAADDQRRFGQIIQQEVFSPLSMHDSALDDQYAIIAHRQRPYSVYEGKLYNSPQTDHSYKWAGGGMIASPADVSRFAVAHLNGEYLSTESVKMLFSKATLNDGQAVEYGVGWNIGFNNYRHRDAYRQNPEIQHMMAAMPNAVMHSGGSMGGITMLILCTDHQRAVTVVKNVDGDESADVFLLALTTLSAYHQQH